MRVAGRAHSTGAGFTLIEMIAVVMLIGLTMAFVLPNFSGRRMTQLVDQCKQIAGRLELARQRAIVTGVPHRLYIDLEEGFMRVEWWVDEKTANAELADEDPDEYEEPPLELDLNGPIPLTPPRADRIDFYPIAGKYGREAFLPEDYYFVGIESASGWFESGAVEIVFARDGTAEYSEIKVSDAWDNVVVLEIQPLVDMVRIRRVEDG